MTKLSNLAELCVGVEKIFNFYCEYNNLDPEKTFRDIVDQVKIPEHYIIFCTYDCIPGQYREAIRRAILSIPERSAIFDKKLLTPHQIEYLENVGFIVGNKVPINVRVCLGPWAETLANLKRNK